MDDLAELFEIGGPDDSQLLDSLIGIGGPDDLDLTDLAAYLEDEEVVVVDPQLFLMEEEPSGLTVSDDSHLLDSGFVEIGGPDYLDLIDVPASDEKLAPSPSPCPVDCCPVADNAAATQLGPLPVANPFACDTIVEHLKQQYFDSWKNIILEELNPSSLFGRSQKKLRLRLSTTWVRLLSDFQNGEQIPDVSIVEFKGPGKNRDLKGNWKEDSIKGMRAHADVPCYVGLKKILKLEDDGSSAYEYTPLFPSKKGSNSLITAVRYLTQLVLLLLIIKY